MGIMHQPPLYLFYYSQELHLLNFDFVSLWHRLSQAARSSRCSRNHASGHLHQIRTAPLHIPLLCFIEIGQDLVKITLA